MGMSPSLFNFSNLEMISFFAVLVRFSILMSVLPVVGEKFVPVPVKILLSLSISLAMFPLLLARGQIRLQDTAVWSSTVGGIVSTLGLEVLFGLILGYTARLVFDAIHFSGNLAGTFMGFASANTYNPFQESHTQIVAEIQFAIAMLLFLAVDGHHSMLRASLGSYSVVGIGKLGLTSVFSQRLIQITSQVIQFGIQLAAPIAISLFAVNVAFGVVAKAMPQLNILTLSFSVTAMVGLGVMLITLEDFQGVTLSLLDKMGDWMEGLKQALVAST